MSIEQGSQKVARQGFFSTLARLVYCDLIKLSHYWVIIAGYVAMGGIATLGCYLVFLGEHAIGIKSGSGYAFAISMVLRCIDIGAPILYVMICILFALEVSNSTVKYILTRPVTRLELILSKYITALLMVILALAIFWAICLGAGGLYVLNETEPDHWALILPKLVFRKELLYLLALVLLILVRFFWQRGKAVSFTEQKIYSYFLGTLAVLFFTFYFYTLLVGILFGLGDLTENEYVIFPAIYMYKQILIATLLLLVPFLAIAAMALMVSTYSSTMGGSIIIGLIAYFFFQILGLIPNSLGVNFTWQGEQYFFPYVTIGFPSQRFVPMYILDDVPTGIPIESWWVWDIQKMLITCAIFFLVFFVISVIGVKRRDFVL